jgi:hypothetical protein
MSATPVERSVGERIDVVPVSILVADAASIRDERSAHLTLAASATLGTGTTGTESRFAGGLSRTRRGLVGWVWSFTPDICSNAKETRLLMLGLVRTVRSQEAGLL